MFYQSKKKKKPLIRIRVHTKVLIFIRWVLNILFCFKFKNMGHPPPSENISYICHSVLQQYDEYTKDCNIERWRYDVILFATVKFEDELIRTNTKTESVVTRTESIRKKKLFKLLFNQINKGN